MHVKLNIDAIISGEPLEAIVALLQDDSVAQGLANTWGEALMRVIQSQRDVDALGVTVDVGQPQLQVTAVPL